jgi:hypothetical protein
MAKKTHRKKRAFRVGDRVSFWLGTKNRYTGIIIEDQGRLAPDGGHVYRISVKADPDFVVTTTQEDLQSLQSV